MSRVTIVIPTLATAVRLDSIVDAIESIHVAFTEAPIILIVVNGSCFDFSVLEKLRNRHDIILLKISEGSLPLAILTARRVIKTEYFCFLDDDDLYLPNAIDRRVMVLDENPEVDLVVTNGYSRKDNHDTLRLSHLSKVSIDPVTALFRENWLASCGGLFRTSSVGVDFFEQLHPYAEWTWLAFRLAIAGKKIAVLDEPTFVINDTPGSASKSDAYRSSFVSLYERMLSSNPPPAIAKIIKRRRCDAWHTISDHQLHGGLLGKAWGSHIRSLMHPSGWRYASYTVRLVAVMIGLNVMQASNKPEDFS